MGQVAVLTIPNWEKVGSPGYRVELTLNQVNQLVQPSSPVDLTSLVISWGKIRSSVKRISKAPEISGASITLDNSQDNVGPLLNFRPNQDYLNDLILIGIGVRGSDGTFDPVTLTSGLLKSIRDSGAVKSIYTIQDPQSVLRNRSGAERESQHLLSQSRDRKSVV